MTQEQFDTYFEDPAKIVSLTDLYQHVVSTITEYYGPRTGEVLTEFCQGFTQQEIAAKHQRTVPWASRQLKSLLKAITESFSEC